MSSSVGICPKNWIHIQGSCYKISSRAVNWNTAKTACEALGCKLAMVKSQSEQQALTQKVRRFVWIGLHRDPRDKSRWIWVDGTRVSYSHWSKGQPNNYGGYQGCVEMQNPSGKWNDERCHYPRHYLCETNGEETLQRLPITRDLSPSKDSDKAAFWWTSIKEKPLKLF